MNMITLVSLFISKIYVEKILRIKKKNWIWSKANLWNNIQNFNRKNFPMLIELISEIPTQYLTYSLRIWIIKVQFPSKYNNVLLNFYENNGFVSNYFQKDFFLFLFCKNNKIVWKLFSRLFLKNYFQKISFEKCNLENKK